MTDKIKKDVKAEIEKKEIMPLTKLPISGSEADNLNDISWRIFRIMAEFVDGFEFLTRTNREVTIWGSARLKPDHKWYQEADKMGKLLGDAGFNVITGGGPGIMEGGNKGAKEAGAVSIGLNIELPEEQRVNPYVTSAKGFHYFFTRKVIMAASSQAYIFFPGGFGTMDEFFEIVTLIQTNKMIKTPVVCVGKEFWEPLDKFIKEVQAEKLETISPEDRDLYVIVDSAEEAFELVKDSEERTIF